MAQKVSTPACGYAPARTTLECRGDGYLWDADYDGYDPEDHSMPCPQCNTLVFLESAKEEAESCVDWDANGQHGTGQTLWENAVQIAQQANPEGYEQALRQIGQVDTLVPADNEQGYDIRRYIYSSAFVPAVST